METLNEALNWAKNNPPPPKYGYASLARALTDAGYSVQAQTVRKWAHRGQVPVGWHKPIEIATNGAVKF